ncbi:hypothetical protein [Haloarcula sp. Atlit-120R]|uniref:hypothetical protein n=1 Tax=Haloarcula sp. Atlit-120R TaxID=2282135 RepID=UPI0018F7BB4A|nr:hypothetical protein [Haloarcula sp. Atlit-120R]
MRVYYSGPSPDNLRRAREHAPSHSHGACWTPAKTTVSGLASEVPYFVDNGAFSGTFEGEVWVNTLDTVLTELPRDPDFVVLPDVPGDAQATIDLHREWLYDKPLPLRSGELMRYWVIQPGLPITDQMDQIEGCQGVFVGGSKRWLRAHGDEIVREARKRDLLTHVGNPSGAEGLAWAYRTGFDSADTTTIFQNGYWHYLDRLEAATQETGTGNPTDQTQLELGDATLAADGGERDV